MKLFLTSAGIVPEVTKEFLELLGRDPQKSRMIFIPTAADPEPDKSFVAKDKERLRELGFAVEEVDLKTGTEKLFQTKLADADVVFVEGGNTFYLLDWIRKSGFGKAVKNFLERGGVYVGVSAGSIVAGPTIETSSDTNICGIKNLNGMSWINFAVKPHFDGTGIPRVKTIASQTKCQFVLLSDTQAILIDGARIEIVGAGQKLIFD